MRRVGAVLVLAVAAGVPGGASAQAISAALSDTIHVGDVVPIAVRVTVEAGERVEWPDTLLLEGAEAENAARMREVVDTLADGRIQRTGVYAVMPWRADSTALPPLPLRVLAADGSARTVIASLPVLTVRSVLPADTTGIQPKPAKGVIGASWAAFPLLLLLLLLLAALGALIWWLRRRRRRQGEMVPLVPQVPPRAWALGVLQRARDAGLVERGDMKPFYTLVAEAVRGYLAALSPAWGEDLTTTELLGRLRSELGPVAARDLERILRPADQVKFARRVPDAATAFSEWATARTWVESFDGPRPAEPMVEAA